VKVREITPRRQYQLKKRAAEMADTRRRITEAAVELHATVGPARTTLSAVAERAGVERHTVYRHFPTEADLYGACSAHYFTANPLPDPEPWCAIRDPRERLERGLNDLYAFYERTEPMFTNVFRDFDLVEAMQPALVPFQDYLTEAAQLLAANWAAGGRRRDLIVVAIGHALDFDTWQSLTGSNDITRAEALRLVTGLVEAAAAE
jgi:AcrR family transcriptional regulator